MSNTETQFPSSPIPDDAAKAAKQKAEAAEKAAYGAAEKTEQKAGSAAQQQGDAPDDSHKLPQSAIVNHILDYPLVQDTKYMLLDSNPISRFGKNTTLWGYRTFVRPFVPILYSAPAGYVAPYTKKLDEFSDSILNKVDEAIPEIKKPSAEIYADAKALAASPYTLSCELLNKYNTTYEEEVKKFPSDKRGFVNLNKARVSSVLILVSNGCNATSEWVMARGEELTQAVESLAKDASEKVEEVKKDAKDTAEEAKKAAEEKKEEGEEKAAEIKKEAEEVANSSGPSASKD